MADTFRGIKRHELSLKTAFRTISAEFLLPAKSMFDFMGNGVKIR